MDVIAIDWSGAAHGAESRIFMAHVRAGQLISLESGRTRSEVIDEVIARRRSCPDGLGVGFDFSFSLPAWFLHEHGCQRISEAWGLVTQHAEQWLADCQPPFWGRPQRPRPDLPEHLRRAERLATVGGISAKSTFQIGGAGAVGTGSLRGIPYLPRLHESGFSIWPFHPPSPFVVMEIYPRLLTGPVHKKNEADRSNYLRQSPWAIAPSLAATIECSEDAFDAAISALVMDRHRDELARLRPSTDPVTLLEGDIWRPAPGPPYHQPVVAKPGRPDPNEETNGQANGRDPVRPTLNSAVRRRRADQAFFLRVGDAIQQNHRALSRLGR